MTDNKNSNSAHPLAKMCIDCHYNINSLLLLLLLYVCVSVDACMPRCAYRNQKTVFRVYLKKKKPTTRHLFSSGNYIIVGRVKL